MSATDKDHHKTHSKKRSTLISIFAGAIILVILITFIGLPLYKRYDIKSQLAEKNIECNIDGLIQAISEQDHESATMLMEWGVLPTENGSFNQIPIMEAAKKGNVPLITLFLDHGADPESMDFKGRTVLWHLVHGRYSDEVYSGVLTLLDAGIDIKREFPDGWNALLWASQRGKVEVVRRLLELGCDIEFKDKRGRNSLIFAVKRGQNDLVELLIKQGADIGVKDAKGCSILWLTSQSPKRNFDIVKVLIANGVDVKGPFTRNWKPLNWAAYFDATEILTLLLEKGVDPNGVDKNGNSALLIAVSNKHLKSATLLLKAGSNPEIRNLNGKNFRDLMPPENATWSALLDKN